MNVVPVVYRNEDSTQSENGKDFQFDFEKYLNGKLSW